MRRFCHCPYRSETTKISVVSSAVLRQSTFALPERKARAGHFVTASEGVYLLQFTLTDRDVDLHGLLRSTNCWNKKGNNLHVFALLHNSGQIRWGGDGFIVFEHSIDV
jgi:hypothetical protein